MSETPEAIQLANDRPWQQGDDLYDWAIDAEEMLRKQHAEIEQLREQNTALNAACAKLQKERDELLGALKWISKRCPAHMEDSLLHPIHQEMAHDAGACARAAIAKCQ